MRAVRATTLAALLLACSPTPDGRTPEACTPDEIVVNGHCYASKEMACDAANCRPPRTCLVLESAPAQISCQR